MRRNALQDDLFGDRSSAYCSICGRPLSDPKSVRRGVGPVCAGKHPEEYPKEDEDPGFSDKFTDEMDLEEGVTIRRENDTPIGTVITNVPHLVVDHSPTGYEFGYGGSGPADLALNILQVYANKAGLAQSEPRTKVYDGNTVDKFVWDLHQEFKWKYIATLDPEEGGVIPAKTIIEYLNERVNNE